MKVCPNPNCGREFSARTKYCSRACYDDVQRQRWLVRSPLRPCEVCDTPTRNKRFCSEDCRNLGHRNSLEEYVVEGPLHCWVWQLSTLKGSGWREHNPYGYLIVDGKRVMAHRYYWERENGPVPEGMVLHHMCENTQCVRPRHLQPVTHAHHSYLHGRTKRDRHLAKAALRLRLAGHSKREIGRRLDVSEKTIRTVLQGEYYDPRRRKDAA